MTLAKRPYRQTARAASTESLRQKIISVFSDLIIIRWIDEITLDEVAASAGTTRQTVIRLFGGKEGVLSAVIDAFHAKAAPRLEMQQGVCDLTAIHAVVEHYEVVGDIAFRFLAQEDRHPALRPQLEFGRQVHRSWVAAQFSATLGALGDEERDRHITRLVVATDLYTWKLLRRDFGHTQAETEALIAGMVARLCKRGES
jgi:AcrR family transcriptional regulator